MGKTEQSVYGDSRTHAVSNVRSLVETVLRTNFGKSSHTEEFRDTLSTNSALSTITPDMLKGKCGTISGELRDALSPVGIDTDICISEARLSTWHRSLKTTLQGVEIIIDGSIGQYVAGHTHVFVGTRAELKQLITNPHTTLINTTISDRAEFFQRTWGNKGQVVRN